jgi:predicted Zn-dependent protease
MRVGLAEALIIAGLLVLFLFTSQIPRVFGWMGRRARSSVNQVKWLYQSLAGKEDEEVRAEEEAGRDLAQAFLSQRTLDPDPDVQARVSAVSARLAAKIEGRRFSVQVVAGPEVNAYALPGGYIFISRRLADLCPEPDEMAFLLGHEMAHVLRRHAAEKQLLQTLLGAVRQGAIVSELLEKGYSREHEREADEQAVELAAKAGFDPGAALRALERLGGRDSESAEDYFSTHPNMDARRLHMREYLAGRKDGKPL